MRASIPIFFAAILFIGCNDDSVTTKDLVTGSCKVEDVSVQKDGFICFEQLKECIIARHYTEDEAKFIIAQNLTKVLIVNVFTSIEFKSDGTWTGTGAKNISGTWKLAADSKIIVTSNDIPGFEETAFMTYITDDEFHIVDYLENPASKKREFLVELSMTK